MSDISMGFATGRPVRIDDDECNVDLPIDIDTESFRGERISLQQLGVGPNPRLYQIFRQYAKLVRILNRIVRHVYQDEALFEAVHAQRRETIIQRLDWQLGVWKSELPSYMSFNFETPWNCIMEEQLQQLGPLMVVFYGSILLLYRPMLRLIDDVNEMDEDLRRCAQRCYNSATFLVNIVDKLDLAAFRRFS
ncbi:hypothetical protein BZG36_04251 [Bifiguratus adelaidae]|uniref:Uncharacterized protein n=1 Tax=Bifiguratus adelaidae TaxID=1938954 RepID=A0A261XVV4_9FUNG|nr:hypothetical protein BZG36_04251 [Bifiguratus adelaidae]